MASNSKSGKPSIRVLVVCLGNICRSPMGEAVLQYEADKRGLPVTVDSAGTAGYHEGSDPDERTISTCKKYGVPINHAARQVQRSDFKDFDYILASDNQNLSNLQRIAPKTPKAKVLLFGSFGDGKAVPDPYYGGISGFEKCFEQVTVYSKGLLNEIYGPEELEDPVANPEAGASRSQT